MFTMGFEWEIGTSYRAVYHNLMERADTIGLEKHWDCTIRSSYGIEIVSYPQDRRALIRTVNDLMDGVNTDLLRTHGCGFHIHIDNSALNDIQMYLLLEWFKREDLKSLFHRWGTYYAGNITDIELDNFIYDNRFANRYRVINPNTGHGTHEFRVPKGVKTAEDMVYMIELVHSIVHYVKNNAGKTTLTRSGYAKYIKSMNSIDEYNTITDRHPRIINRYEREGQVVHS